MKPDFLASSSGRNGCMSIIGKNYLERGHPVKILVSGLKAKGPRNVLIERADGSQVVRPFRGLRKTKRTT